MKGNKRIEIRADRKKGLSYTEIERYAYKPPLGVAFFTAIIILVIFGQFFRIQ